MRLFLDFDGTVTEDDVVDAILERYADPGWRDIEERWRTGSIGSRECLREQMSLVRATEGELHALIDEVALDDGFAGLLQACARHHVPVHILSDGFDYCIRRIFRRAGGGELGRLLENVDVWATHLEPAGDRTWRVDFPFSRAVCAHGCATCKPTVIRHLRTSDSAPVVFVGDGLSDRYAASTADVVFAKNALAEYCRDQRIACIGYQDLAQVATALESMLHDSAIRIPTDRLTRGRAWAQ